MNNFERRFGGFSIRNLTNYIILARIIGMFLIFIESPIITSLLYDAPSIMSGEVWRLFTFVFIPSSGSFWFIFEVLFLFWIGTNLENIWGSFKYSMYFLGSIAGVAIATLIIYFGNMSFELLIGNFMLMSSLPSLLIYMMFFPFAWYNGDQEMFFAFIFPLKVKYLAIVNLFFIIWRLRDISQGIELISGVSLLQMPIVWLLLGLSTINVFVFFACVVTVRIRQKKRSMQFKSKVNKSQKVGVKKAVHRCAVCGITENDDPGMSFRYCSKCEGDYEYCEKHLRDHKHKTKIVPFQ